MTSLLKLITGTVEPRSCRDAGGKIGAIKELSGQLIVTQTEPNQKAVGDWVGRLQELLQPVTAKKSPGVIDSVDFEQSLSR